MRSLLAFSFSLPLESQRLKTKRNKKNLSTTFIPWVPIHSALIQKSFSGKFSEVLSKSAWKTQTLQISHSPECAYPAKMPFFYVTNCCANPGHLNLWLQPVCQWNLIQSASLHQGQCLLSELVQEAEQLSLMLGSYQINSSSSLPGPPFDAQEALGSFPKLTSVGGAFEKSPNVDSYKG